MTIRRVLDESQSEGVSRAGTYANFSVWRNDNAWSHIYATSELIKTPAGSSVACLPAIGGFIGARKNIAVIEDDVAPGLYRYQVEREIDGMESRCTITEQALSDRDSLPPAEIRFRRINPTKYEVNVSQATDPFLLVFSESYNSQWVLKIGPSGDARRSLDDELAGSPFRHLAANGYANSWWIDRPGTYRLTIEYLPQRWYQIGSAISAATLLICLVTAACVGKKRLGGNRSGLDRLASFLGQNQG
jgi:hypothetical protein